VWISAFINVTGAPAQVLDAFLGDRFVPVISDALLDEIHEVLHWPRIRRRWQLSGDDVATALALLTDRAIQAIPTGGLRLCRDPDDDILLETAIVGGAQYFVSRDDDIKRDQELMARLQERGVQVLSVAQFLSLLAARST
jgi:putative PIN family toxin of toxin-antitoxin system